jgi:glycerate dehydrogenase
MGIVGLGNIGMEVARIASAFGMEVLAVTSKKGELPYGVRSVSMNDLFALSDVVSLHCPLTDDTRNLVCSKRLETMKPTAIIINTGRGPLVNDAELAEALNRKLIAAYAADVLTVEPAEADNPLLQARNCYLTPHIAWATREARQRLMSICVENIKAFLAGKPINVVGV